LLIPSILTGGLKYGEYHKLYQAFVDFTDIPHYAKVATTEEILALNGNMNINFYVKKDNSDNNISFSEVFSNWQKASSELKKSMQTLFEELN
jgi:type I restriction enzyme M protein